MWSDFRCLGPEEAWTARRECDGCGPTGRFRALAGGDGGAGAKSGRLGPATARRNPGILHLVESPHPPPKSERIRVNPTIGIFPPCKILSLFPPSGSGCPVVSSEHPIRVNLCNSCLRLSGFFAKRTHCTTLGSPPVTATSATFSLRVPAKRTHSSHSISAFCFPNFCFFLWPSAQVSPSQFFQSHASGLTAHKSPVLKTTRQRLILDLPNPIPLVMCGCNCGGGGNEHHFSFWKRPPALATA